MNKTLVVALACISLTACDSIPFINNTPDYRSAAGRSRALEVPPDLTSVTTSDAYTIPGGSTTYSEYSQGQEAQAPQQEKILPTSDSVRLERAGSERWLVVNAPPEKVWPVVRDFWADLGFAVRVENPQTGVMETEWVDPSAITKKPDGSYVDKFQGWLDKLNALQTQQKFRTRMERGGEGTTEIYLSHQALSGAQDDGINRVRTRLGNVDNGYKLKNTQTEAEKKQAIGNDVDAELLRRLMVKLGLSEQQSKAIMAENVTQARATVVNQADGTHAVKLNDAFDRAWRRTGLALDRIGYLVEDRDRSKGIYYVRYSEPEADTASTVNQKKGWVSKLKFWGNSDDASGKAKVDPGKQFRILLDDTEDGGTLVRVADDAGKPANSKVAEIIVNQLFGQLK